MVWKVYGSVNNIRDSHSFLGCSNQAWIINFRSLALPKRRRILGRGTCCMLHVCFKKKIIRQTVPMRMDILVFLLWQTERSVLWKEDILLIVSNYMHWSINRGRRREDAIRKDSGIPQRWTNLVWRWRTLPSDKYQPAWNINVENNKAPIIIGKYSRILCRRNVP